MAGQRTRTDDDSSGRLHPRYDHLRELEALRNLEVNRQRVLELLFVQPNRSDHGGSDHLCALSADFGWLGDGIPEMVPGIR